MCQPLLQNKPAYHTQPSVAPERKKEDHCLSCQMRLMIWFSNTRKQNLSPRLETVIVVMTIINTSYCQTTCIAWTAGETVGRASCVFIVTQFRAHICVQCQRRSQGAIASAVPHTKPTSQLRKGRNHLNDSDPLYTSEGCPVQAVTCQAS
jgi:hypothetical protein